MAGNGGQWLAVAPVVEGSGQMDSLMLPGWVWRWMAMRISGDTAGLVVALCVLCRVRLVTGVRAMHTRGNARWAMRAWAGRMAVGRWRLRLLQQRDYRGVRATHVVRDAWSDW